VKVSEDGTVSVLPMYASGLACNRLSVNVCHKWVSVIAEPALFHRTIEHPGRVKVVVTSAYGDRMVGVPREEALWALVLEALGFQPSISRPFSFPSTHQRREGLF